MCIRDRSTWGRLFYWDFTSIISVQMASSNVLDYSAFHSAFNQADDSRYLSVCGILVLPIKTKYPGPAPAGDPNTEDIIDETIKYYRLNLLFKNFDCRGPGDKILIYLTVFMHYCLKAIQNETTGDGAKKRLADCVKEASPQPGDPKFFMGGLIFKPDSAKEIDFFQQYMKQLREEMANRLLYRLFTASGRVIDFKVWISYNKRKFMGLNYSDKVINQVSLQRAVSQTIIRGSFVDQSSYSQVWDALCLLCDSANQYLKLSLIHI
eukprot:TRINITY_DN5095_c0_g1_i1.p1 TRINITY_DN5095_c0_g1~~TRINITY_DN5095_c0_g1_i1.p1  ORF type:complete len:265 (+),score=65.78 TRINITY_DN5095_c0_g1_i1:65-859(+)